MQGVQKKNKVDSYFFTFKDNLGNLFIKKNNKELLEHNVNLTQHIELQKESKCLGFFNLIHKAPPTPTLFLSLVVTNKIYYLNFFNFLQTVFLAISKCNSDITYKCKLVHYKHIRPVI